MWRVETRRMLLFCYRRFLMKISIGLLPVWGLGHGDANFQARFCILIYQCVQSFGHKFCISIYQCVTGRWQINFKRKVTGVPFDHIGYWIRNTDKNTTGLHGARLKACLSKISSTKKCLCIMIKLFSFGAILSIFVKFCSWRKR